MNKQMKIDRLKYLYLILFLFACLIYFLAGCKSTEKHRKQADQAADEIIKEKQASALGRTETFTIEKPSDTLRRRLLIDQNLPYSGNASLGLMYLEPIEHWPEDSYLDPSKEDRAKISTSPWQGEKTLTLSLIDALQVGARNSREYQDQKEEVFRAALNLDLKRNEFKSIFSASAESGVSADLKDGDATVGAENSATGSLTRKLKSGLTVAARLGLDLVSLLTGDRSSSLGLFADATISIPLLRGSGKHIVTEPLTQAERDVVYAIYRFERFKNTFAVQIAADYLEVLKLQDRISNAEENYRSLITSSRRARRLADAGRISEIQVDQAKQEELRARERWISAGESYKRRLDSFKILLGLPTDAIISLDREELLNLSTIKGRLLGGSTD
ncbi:MAG: TolC family protein, partial [Spirochaetes bacterium]|nr:TolC family protein [Spirochaetota bacterium]